MDGRSPRWPEEAANTQPFVVESVDATKGSIVGSFYNSTISWSRLSTAWGKVVVTAAPRATSSPPAERVRPRLDGTDFPTMTR